MRAQTIWIVVTERGDRPYVSTTKPPEEFLKTLGESSAAFGRSYVARAVVMLPEVDAFAGQVVQLGTL